MNKIPDTLENRTARIRAYRAGAYAMRVPPVCTTLWDEEAWCNWVHFTDPSLSGFIPPDSVRHRQAQCAL